MGSAGGSSQEANITSSSLVHGCARVADSDVVGSRLAVEATIDGVGDVVGDLDGVGIGAFSQASSGQAQGRALREREVVRHDLYP